MATTQSKASLKNEQKDVRLAARLSCEIKKDGVSAVFFGV